MTLNLREILELTSRKQAFFWKLKLHNIKYGNKRVSEYAKDGIKFLQQF